ncbi:MAG: 4-(cytidine 5'-diphospho)-2-C-methyl-D-erythritol kinase [Brooklawnia sp.]
MSSVRVPGKINLALCVAPRRPDGYHELSTLFHAVSLYDEVSAEAGTDAQISLTMHGEGSEDLACDHSNLAVRAAELLRARYGSPGLGVRLHIDKQIPMAGGMAGGSADAAGVLLACNDLWQLGCSLDELSDLAAELGSDVPFLLFGGNALGTGRGEQLVPQPTPGRLEWVFALAPRGLSTPLVYQRFDQMAERGAITPSAELGTEMRDGLVSGVPARVAPALRNDLQAPALELYPELADTLAAGLQAGALAAIVCGSGPTCAFLAADSVQADRLAAELAGCGQIRATRRAHGPVPGPVVPR